MGNDLLITVSIGLAASLVFLVFALRAGKDKPQRAWAWVAGLVLLGASVVFRFALIFLMGREGGFSDVAPIIVGTAAVIVAGVVALWRAVWAGWFLIGSAIGIPLIQWLTISVMANPREEGVPPEGLFVTYSIPAAVTGVLFLIAGSTRRASAARGN